MAKKHFIRKAMCVKVYAEVRKLTWTNAVEVPVTEVQCFNSKFITETTNINITSFQKPVLQSKNHFYFMKIFAEQMNLCSEEIRNGCDLISNARKHFI